MCIGITSVGITDSRGGRREVIGTRGAVGAVVDSVVRSVGGVARSPWGCHIHQFKNPGHTRRVLSWVDGWVCRTVVTRKQTQRRLVVEGFRMTGAMHAARHRVASCDDKHVATYFKVYRTVSVVTANDGMSTAP